MAFVLMLIYLLYGIKFLFRAGSKQEPGVSGWNIALILCLFSYTLRALLADHYPFAAHLFNSAEYLTPLFFMICVRVNFDDDFELGWVEKGALSLFAVLILLFAFGDQLGIPPAMVEWQITVQLGTDALAIAWGYWCILNTWSDDLIQSRRRARMFFVVGCGPAVLTGVSLYYYAIFHQPDWTLVADIFVSGSIFVLGLTGLFLFTELIPGVVDSGVKPNTAALRAEIQELSGADVVVSQSENETHHREPQVELTEDQKLLLSLAQVMEGQQRYTEMGISLAKLSQYSEIPEYRLRQLINKDLGFRNFNAYLNHYRIQLAQQMLLAPESQESILNISLAVGYKSLSTFNKAFKDITSLTPSEYRKRGQA